MAAYVVFIREGVVTDAEAMEKYRSGMSTPRSDMKVHTVYGAHEVIEGEDCDGIVILEFPDKAAANDWYYGDEYQAKAKFRQQAAPYRGFIVEGL
jgi:uncharacterized protein (DUF1330 family)